MEFIDPPAEARGERTQRWKDIVSTLKENKGQWGLVGNFSPGVATHIRRGMYKAFLEGMSPEESIAHVYMSQHWKITTRKTDDGKRNDIYIKWLG